MQQDTKMILKDTEDQMYRNKLYESSSARSRSIDIIMKAVYEKSEREMIHSMRVSKLCEAIGRSLRFSKDEVNQIRTAGLVHDIGKIGIDDKILNKTEPFNAQETKEMQKHCEVGYRILSSANEFSEIANFVLEHHEQWDGSGYPRNLKGDQISQQARIIAVADTYDAMTSGKPNKKRVSTKEAIAEMSRRAGTRLDPDIVRIFIENDIGPKTQ
jgi:putative nucleotidyltransferase with HDIG domain